MLTGEQGGGMASRGLITSYNRSPELGFWKEGSECDVVEGRQDGFTMPALIRRRDQGRSILLLDFELKQILPWFIVKSQRAENFEQGCAVLALSSIW